MSKVFRLVLSAVALFLYGSLAFADEPTRRAFVVGVERYGDSEIQSLTRSDSDAKDLGHDLEQVGFESKNVTVLTDVRSKADFNKKFDAFLNSIKEGDFVLFFFSGHGIGVESSGADHLLLGDAKSPVTFTRSKLSGAEKKDTNIVKAKMAQYLDQYSTEEIPNSGVSVDEIIEKIGARKPATMFLDSRRLPQHVARRRRRAAIAEAVGGIRQPAGAVLEGAGRHAGALFRLVRRAGGRKLRFVRPAPQFAVHRGLALGAGPSRPIAA